MGSKGMLAGYMWVTVRGVSGLVVEVAIWVEVWIAVGRTKGWSGGRIEIGVRAGVGEGWGWRRVLGQG